MRKKPKPRLTAGEIEILEMLWNTGRVTLSAAHKAMKRAIGYTTVQTRLNRLVEKGVVLRSDDRPAQYTAAITPDDVSAGHLDLLLKRVSGGSVVPLVTHLVRDRRLSADEVSELKALIEQAERDLRSSSKK